MIFWNFPNCFTSGVVAPQRHQASRVCLQTADMNLTPPTLDKLHQIEIEIKKRKFESFVNAQRSLGWSKYLHHRRTMIKSYTWFPPQKKNLNQILIWDHRQQIMTTWTHLKFGQNDLVEKEIFPHHRFRFWF